MLPEAGGTCIPNKYARVVLVSDVTTEETDLISTWTSFPQCLPKSLSVWYHSFITYLGEEVDVVAARSWEHTHKHTQTHTLCRCQEAIKTLPLNRHTAMEPDRAPTSGCGRGKPKQRAAPSGEGGGGR